MVNTKKLLNWFVIGFFVWFVWTQANVQAGPLSEYFGEVAGFIGRTVASFGEWVANLGNDGPVNGGTTTTVPPTTAASGATT
jgi:hypothetical protein